MSIKQNGGVFGRNPTFNDVTIDGTLTFDGDIDIDSDLKVDGDLDVTGNATVSGDLTVGSATSQNGVFGAVLGSGGSNEGVVVVSGAAGTGWLGFNNANNASIPGQVTYNHSTNLLSFYSSGTISLTGAATFSDNIIIGTSGKGIDFSATAGTGTSELLDDYEEGTWTAVDSSGAGVAIVSNYAVYTKIGNAVTISCYISVPAGAAGAVALLGGLPYAPATNNNVMVAHNDGALDIIGKTNTASFLVINPSGSSSTTVWSSLAGNYVFITGTYYV